MHQQTRLAKDVAFLPIDQRLDRRVESLRDSFLGVAMLRASGGMCSKLLLSTWQTFHQEQTTEPRRHVHHVIHV